ncbi:uncharacterized protein LOC129765410 [Toxorhynchites rutilus septentrionalis]|uniref:uncharacterized protein LOC129765410 n=1 Tax=Toxorhynchites rutilus septentrionalis TaxID=329112 RepID=UPI0024798409|nr:uncharacterized protein LOC129765410 [Toxorhynchites rutilus septentrionalis]
MKLYNNPIALTVLWIFVYGNDVKCITNSKSASLSNKDDQKLKDLNTDETSFWNPQPEYYHDRYKHPDRTDFVTSLGSSENKHSGNPASSYSYHEREKISPFSSGGGSAYYTSGGIFDRKQVYGSPQPVDHTTYIQEYDNHYEHYPHDHGYSLGHSYGGKSYGNSVLFPLAGAALLGIAAVLVANPVLLHLGAVAGKRKRRDIPSSAHNLAYIAHFKKSLASK